LSRSGTHSTNHERKHFFFEKKKQKTFGCCRGLPNSEYHKYKSFLVLFFKKEHSCFLAFLIHNRIMT